MDGLKLWKENRFFPLEAKHVTVKLGPLARTHCALTTDVKMKSKKTKKSVLIF